MEYEKFVSRFSVNDGNESHLPFGICIDHVHVDQTTDKCKENELQISGKCQGDKSDDLKTEEGLNQDEFIRWRRYLLVVCYASVLVELLIGISSIVEGLKKDSSGTFGFGLEISLDILTSFIVIWRFYGEEGYMLTCEKETSAVLVLSTLMCFFSVGALTKAIYNLADKSFIFKEITLMIVCAVGFFSFSVLATIKVLLSRKLQSKAVLLDGICTFGNAAMGLALVLSLLVYHFTKLWFLDSVVAILISLVVFAVGFRSLYQYYKTGRDAVKV